MSSFFQNVEQFMDEIACIYDKICHPSGLYRINFFKHVINKYQFDNAEFLDMSCSTGETCIQLAQNGFKATGIDFSSGMIELCKEKTFKKNLDCEFAIMDMRNLNFSNKQFDIIFNNSLVWINSLYDVDKVISSVNKLMNQNNIFIIDIPNHSHFLKTYKPYHLKGVKLANEAIYKIVRYDNYPNIENQIMKTCQTYIQLDYINNKQYVYSHDFTVRFHSLNELDKILSNYNIKIVDIMGDYGLNDINNCVNLQIICKK